MILRPAVQKRYVELAEPTLADQRTDLARLTDAITDLELTADLPAAIRSAQTVGQRYITIPAVEEAFGGAALDLAFWRGKAAEFNRIGTTVVMATHDLDLVRRLVET